MNNYQRSIDKVLSYIDSNLHEKHELDTLAEIALLSKFHFHRIIKAYLGEPLGAYINRLRLETAVKLLRYSNQAINEIAYQIGYETDSAFSKSFKKKFGITPRSVRKEKEIIVQHKSKTIMHDFQLIESIKKLNDIQVIYQQSRGKTGDHTTNQNWNELYEKALAHNILNFQTKFYGINWDDPDITPVEKVRYDACISIQNIAGLENAFSCKTIRGGKYLCFLYTGDYQNLSDVYNHIFREWIIKMNYELREEPIFEQYINNKETTPKEELQTEIFIPIK